MNRSVDDALESVEDALNAVLEAVLARTGDATGLDRADTHLRAAR